jgi:hypothetical protein
LIENIRRGDRPQVKIRRIESTVIGVAEGVIGIVGRPSKKIVHFFLLTKKVKQRGRGKEGQEKE